MKHRIMKACALITALLTLLAATGCKKRGVTIFDPEGKTDFGELKTEDPLSKKVKPTGAKTSVDIRSAELLGYGMLPITLDARDISEGAGYFLFICAEDVELTPAFYDTDPAGGQSGGKTAASGRSSGSGGRASAGKALGTFGIGWRVFVFTKSSDSTDVYERELGEPIKLKEGGVISAKAGQYILIMRSVGKGVNDTVEPFMVLTSGKEE